MDEEDLTPLVISLRDVAETWRRLSATEDGRIVIGWMISKFGFTRRSTYDKDPVRMGVNEGQRSVVMEIGKLLEIDLEQLDANEAEEGDL